MSRIPDAQAPGAPFVLVLIPDDDDPGAQLRSAPALADEDLTIDLGRIAVIDPPLLRALRALAARGRPGSVALTGATPEVYKALHVAGVAGLFRRG